MAHLLTSYVRPTLPLAFVCLSVAINSAHLHVCVCLCVCVCWVCVCMWNCDC